MTEVKDRQVVSDSLNLQYFSKKNKCVKNQNSIARVPALPSIKSQAVARENSRMLKPLGNKNYKKGHLKEQAMSPQHEKN